MDPECKITELHSDWLDITLHGTIPLKLMKTPSYEQYIYTYREESTLIGRLSSSAVWLLSTYTQRPIHIIATKQVYVYTHSKIGMQITIIMYPMHSAPSVWIPPADSARVNVLIHCEILCLALLCSLKISIMFCM